MQNTQLKNKIFELLKTDNRLWDENKVELNQTLLLDLIESIDEKVIEILLADDELRDKFFVKIKDVYVFKTNDFKFFMEENRVYNSYTQYKNRIGLTDGKKFLKDSDDVVLDFPYKDCVLEGGQSSEEGLDSYYEYDKSVTKTEEKKGFKAESYNLKQSKRKEVFFNQVLAQDEIDRLFDEKALVSWERYTQNGENEVGEIKRDEDGAIKENLVIKGNNLLALHSLESEFKGKIKLIYIDPPYNTGGDSFKYNDNFNHSSWLTFMRNRLEIAKRLLKDDGVIFVSLDDKEAHYCKVLMDEIFKRENFIADICHKARASVSNDKIISPSHNHILLFAKHERKVFKNKHKFGIKKELKGFNLSDKNGNYKLVPVDGPGGASKGNPYYEFLGIKNYWRFSKSTMQEMYDDGLIVKNSKTLSQKYYESKAKLSKQTVTTWWDNGYLTSSATSQLKELMGDKIFNNPKNIDLLKLICELWTENNDIILDYHAGSGTTAHAVLELNKKDDGNRKFITIEQMDYINTVTVPRVQKVMEKENIDDSFIYFELAKWNEKAKEEIQDCENLQSLVELFDTLYNTYFLNYNLKIKEFKDKVIKEDNFKSLSLEEQKKMFLTMLDLNQMYVQKTEMEDSKFAISEDDQKLTNEFYNGEK